MKRRLKIAALIVRVVCPAGAVVPGAGCIYTEAGLRFAVARLPETLGKVTLQIENVHGTIAGGFGADARRCRSASAATCASRTARRASTSGRCWWAASRCARRDADLVLVEVKRRAASTARHAAQVPAAAAQHQRRARHREQPGHHRAQRQTRGVQRRERRRHRRPQDHPDLRRQRHLRRAAGARHRRAARRRIR